MLMDSIFSPSPFRELVANMKLQLLVVFAVVVLVPSLAEGRNVSRCELKEKLGDAIVLRGSRLNRLKNYILARGEILRWLVWHTGL